MDHDVPPISIVVPTYNESEDIRGTLEALIRQTYPAKEIIVVDDSTDDTPHIVEEFTRDGVVLVRPPVRRGRCEARNTGIRHAHGDVVVILNADVRPQPDFLSRIAAHYRRDAGLVLVESRIENTERLFPRYLEALHREVYGRDDSLNWTEGLSCRRDAALAAGLFPETPIPLVAGEDVYFGAELARRCRKVFDRSIVVPHAAPHTLRGFWRQQEERGHGTPGCRYFLQHWPLAAIAGVAALKTLRSAVWLGLLVPPLLYALRLSRHSPRGFRDVPGFWAACVLGRMGQTYGEWAGVSQIARFRRRRLGGRMAEDRAG